MIAVLTNNRNGARIRLGDFFVEGGHECMRSAFGELIAHLENENPLLWDVDSLCERIKAPTMDGPTTYCGSLFSCYTIDKLMRKSVTSDFLVHYLKIICAYNKNLSYRCALHDHQHDLNVCSSSSGSYSSLEQTMTKASVDTYVAKLRYKLLQLRIGEGKKRKVENDGSDRRSESESGRHELLKLWDGAISTLTASPSSVHIRSWHGAIRNKIESLTFDIPDDDDISAVLVDDSRILLDVRKCLEHLSEEQGRMSHTASNNSDFDNLNSSRTTTVSSNSSINSSTSVAPGIESMLLSTPSHFISIILLAEIFKNEKIAFMGLRILRTLAKENAIMEKSWRGNETRGLRNIYHTVAEGADLSAEELTEAVMTLDNKLLISGSIDTSRESTSKSYMDLSNDYSGRCLLFERATAHDDDDSFRTDSDYSDSEEVTDVLYGSTISTVCTQNNHDAFTVDSPDIHNLDLNDVDLIDANSNDDSNNHDTTENEEKGSSSNVITYADSKSSRFPYQTTSHHHVHTSLVAEASKKTTLHKSLEGESYVPFQSDDQNLHLIADVKDESDIQNSTPISHPRPIPTPEPRPVHFAHIRDVSSTKRVEESKQKRNEPDSGRRRAIRRTKEFQRKRDAERDRMIAADKARRQQLHTVDMRASFLRIGSVKNTPRKKIRETDRKSFNSQIETSSKRKEAEWARKRAIERIRDHAKDKKHNEDMKKLSDHVEEQKRWKKRQDNIDKFRRMSSRKSKPFEAHFDKSKIITIPDGCTRVPNEDALVAMGLDETYFRSISSLAATQSLSAEVAAAAIEAKLQNENTSKNDNINEDEKLHSSKLMSDAYSWVEDDNTSMDDDAHSISTISSFAHSVSFDQVLKHDVRPKQNMFTRFTIHIGRAWGLKEVITGTNAYVVVSLGNCGTLSTGVAAGGTSPKFDSTLHFSIPSLNHMRPRGHAHDHIALLLYSRNPSMSDDALGCADLSSDSLIESNGQSIVVPLYPMDLDGKPDYKNTPDAGFIELKGLIEDNK